MAENSPSLWAAADLDPISPSPVYPPSPVIVPALQDRAESYIDMSSTGYNAARLAVATTAGASVIDEKPNHAQTAAPSIHNNMANGVLDTSLGKVEGADSDKAPNGVAQRAETASIGMSAGDMQEPETSRLDATKAKQDVSQPNKLTPSSDISVPMRDIADVAAPLHISNPPTSRTSPDDLPSLLPQTAHHKLRDDSQDSFDAVTSDVNSTQRSPPPSEQPTEQPTANNNLGSGTTRHASGPDTNIQALLDEIATYSADTNAAHISASEPVSGGDGILQTTILQPKPSSSELISTQSYRSIDGFASCIPTASESSSVPLPLSNGSALASYAGAAPNTYIDAVQGTIDPYNSATITLDANSIPSHATSLSQSGSANGSLPLEQTPSTDHADQQWEIFLQEERKYVSEAKWDRFPEGSRIFIGPYGPSFKCSSI